MALETNIVKINQTITDLHNKWRNRNKKFREWYEYLLLVDQLATRGLDTYVSNEPATFYNMAHYLLTKGIISHLTPIANESALELDRRAKVSRACEYLWDTIDRDRQLSGQQPFIDELSHFLLILGWYARVAQFNPSTGLLNVQVWNPYDVYPRYSNNRMSACVHSYSVDIEEAKEKAATNNWNYAPSSHASGVVTIDDYFQYEGNILYNNILIDGKSVTGWVDRPEMQVLVAPVGGFPDKGSLTSTKKTNDYTKLLGRGIFEVNEVVYDHFNKWKSMVTHALRSAVFPITQEFSASPQATPEQLRDTQPLFHYAPGEGGLARVAPPAMPMEIQANLLELHRERQKGSFNDAVYGMIEGTQAGYAISLLASSSANQILYPYMDGKHFVIAETDRFWLSKLKTSKRVFQVKGKFIEKLSPTDIPEDVTIRASSRVATTKDWLELGTVSNMVDKHLDEETILSEIYGMNDPEAIRRKRSLDRMLNSAEAQLAEKIVGFYSHADYLSRRGDSRGAGIFRRIAQAMESQIGAPAPGQGRSEEMTRILQQRQAGTPEERARVAPEVSPPETQGYTPAELRQAIGRGRVRAL